MGRLTRSGWFSAKSSSGRRRNKRSHSTRPEAHRLRIEPLEDRRLLATYYVTHSNDDMSVGSLRWAITEANANPGADTIDTVERQGSITIPHDINLTLNGTQLPTITDDLAIIGHTGAGIEVGRLSVSGNNLSRVLQVNSGVTVHLSGVTITNGNAKSAERGGGIYNLGTLSITGSTISNNDAARGGGIYSDGTLNITNSTISNNHADTGGGIYNVGAFSVAGPTLNITGSTISGNRAGVRLDPLNPNAEKTSNGIARGGGIYSLIGDVMLDLVTLEGNTAQGGDRGQENNGFAAEGGGIHVEVGFVTIVDSTIRSNTAQGGAGGVGTQGPVGTSPDPILIRGANGGNGGDGGNGGTGSGGGVFLGTGNLTMIGSTLSGNVARGGAGGAGGAGGTGGTGTAGRDAIAGTGATSNFRRPLVAPGGTQAEAGMPGTAPRARAEACTSGAPNCG